MSFFDECNRCSPYDEDHCRFAIWGPGEQDFVENRAFSGYAIQTQKLEDAAEKFAYCATVACMDINDYKVQKAICADCGIDFNSLANDEVNFLKEAIERRLR